MPRKTQACHCCNILAFLSSLLKKEAGFIPLLFFALFLLIFNTTSTANEEFDKEVLFYGIDNQIHDYSCGAAALAMLISGTSLTSVNQKQVIDTIFKTEEEKESGYSGYELAEAAKKLGFNAQWRKVNHEFLPKITQPVIILIGLNTELAHYVVLKGVVNNEAFLADSIRGNIRIPYDDLIKESISTIYPKWYVMAVEPIDKNIKSTNSTLFLKNDKFKVHATLEQSNILTTASVAKPNQLIISYDFSSSAGTLKSQGYTIDVNGVVHSIGARYGLTDQIELGANLFYTENTQSLNLGDAIFKSGYDSRIYRAYINRKLESEKGYGLIYGSNFSFSDFKNTFNGGLNLTAFLKGTSTQFFSGVTLNKPFSSDISYDQYLPNYQTSIFFGANKTLADRFLVSSSINWHDDFGKNITPDFNYYTLSTKLSYSVNSYQITPIFDYSFGSIENFALGLSFNYLGGW